MGVVTYYQKFTFRDQKIIQQIGVLRVQGEPENCLVQQESSGHSGQGQNVYFWVLFGFIVLLSRIKRNYSLIK